MLRSPFFSCSSSRAAFHLLFSLSLYFPTFSFLDRHRWLQQVAKQRNARLAAKVVPVPQMSGWMRKNETKVEEPARTLG
jgi:hypothetical protein